MIDHKIDRIVLRLAVHERRLQERERQSLWLRLQACEHRLTMRSSVGAKTYDGDQIHDGYESMPPPGAFNKEGPHDMGLGSLESLLRPVRNALELLEQALDFDSGWGVGRDTSLLIGAEKDAELQDRWVGVSSKTVSRLAPHLGSQRTVERARARMGVQPGSGLPLVVRAVA